VPQDGFYNISAALQERRVAWADESSLHFEEKPTFFDSKMNHFKVDFGDFEASRCQRYKTFIYLLDK
jgi:hypothetical protein